MQLLRPSFDDGYAVNQLISRCAPLDTNSVYCNLLQAGHFSGTSVLAKSDNEQAVGFVSGYMKPEDASTLFIWQVAVDESARGQGLAIRLLKSLLERPSLEGVLNIETTITADNQASWALFRKLADKLGASLSETVLLEKEKHFRGEHDSEYLVRIGPFNFDANRWSDS